MYSIHTKINTYVIFMTLFLCAISNSSGSTNKCVKFYTQSPAFFDMPVNSEKANQFLEKIERIMTQKTGQKPKWVEDLAEDEREFLVIKKLSESFLSSPSLTTIRKLTTRLYRYRIQNVILEVSKNPLEGLKIIKKIPDAVLTNRLERGIATKSAKQAFEESGLLNFSSGNAFSNFFYANRNRVNISVAALLSAPSIILGNLSGIFLPKIRLTQNEKLAQIYNEQISDIGYEKVLENLRRDYGRTVKYELLYGVVRRVVNIAAMVAVSTSIFSIANNHVKSIVAKQEQVKIIEDLSSRLSQQSELGSPEQEAQILLNEFIEQQKVQGREISKKEIETIRAVFQTSFADQAKK